MAGVTSPVRRPALLLAPVLLLAVTSCGGDAEESAEAADSPKATVRASEPANGPSATPSGDAGTGEAANSAEPAQRPAPGDLVNFACTQNAKGVWAAEGDLRNPTKEPMVYSVTVVTVQGEMVNSHAEVEVVLAPDESTGFELPRLTRGSVDSCMPRVVRAPR